LFSILDTDFAMHKWTWDHRQHDDGWEFASGTLYFDKTDWAEALLLQWIQRCQADPFTWDQQHLASAWCDINSIIPLRTAWLPRSYLQIENAPAFEQPVVKHWQASRKLRDEGRISIQPLEMTEEGKADRRLNRLWRTPEELFWIQQGVQHIKPETGFEFPEGFDVGNTLRRAIGSHFPTLEIGCGVGRIASLFSPQEYIGVDVNPVSLTLARAKLPEHALRIFDQGYRYPAAPSAFFYTVLLHVSDQAVEKLLAQAVVGRRRLIIAEIMDRRWRRGGSPPVFNRDPEDYLLMMMKLGFRLTGFIKSEYERYNQDPWNVGKDSRLTFLVFDAA
jgi:SAM-dependent methyltransferase